MKYTKIMNFQEFWEHVSKFDSEEFFTLSQKKSFIADFQDNNLIIKPGKTNDARPINRNEMLKVFTKASKLSASQRFIPNNYHDDTFHSSYLVSIMKSVLSKKNSD
jgi:hypothetical protein